jgi:hypothetical protein
MIWTHLDLLLRNGPFLEGAALPQFILTPYKYKCQCLTFSSLVFSLAQIARKRAAVNLFKK